MAEETKSVRLNKAAKEFNVGIANLVDFLEKKGHKVDLNPNTRLTAEQYDLLSKAFQSEREVKEQADKIELTPNNSSVTIGNAVSGIGEYAFYGCSSLTSVTIGNSVTSIGNYAFCNCNGLTSVTIGDSVTCIGESAFENCHGLTSVVIGSGVTDIHDMAFEDCDHLSDITCKAVTPPTVANHDAFEGVWKGLPLSVPNESVSQYQIAYAWREFTNIIGMNIPEDYTITVTVNNASMGSVSGAGTYANGETVTLTATANMGYRFVRWSNGMENNPYTFTATEDVDLIAYFEAIPTQGINEANVTFNINSGNGVIVLNGVEGKMMRIFDILGHVIVSERAVDNKQYQMPSSGVYFVQVGNYPAQKVVVVK